MIRFPFMEPISLDQETDESALRDLLTKAAAQGVHTVVVTTTSDNAQALDLLRNLRAELHTEGDQVHAELETDPSGQLAYLWQLSEGDRIKWLEGKDPNWWMHRLLVLNHHPEWAELKTWLVDHHVKLFGRPPGRVRGTGR